MFLYIAGGTPENEELLDRIAGPRGTVIPPGLAVPTGYYHRHCWSFDPGSAATAYVWIARNRRARETKQRSAAALPISAESGQSVTVDLVWDGQTLQPNTEKTITISVYNKDRNNAVYIALNNGEVGSGISTDPVPQGVDTNWRGKLVPPRRRVVFGTIATPFDLLELRAWIVGTGDVAITEVTRVPLPAKAGHDVIVSWTRAAAAIDTPGERQHGRMRAVARRVLAKLGGTEANRQHGS
jgi:hypothetical protein